MIKTRISRYLVASLGILAATLCHMRMAHAEWTQGEMELSESPILLKNPTDANSTSSAVANTINQTLPGGGGSVKVGNANASGTNYTPTGGAFALAQGTYRVVCQWVNELGPPSQIKWGDTWGWTQDSTSSCWVMFGGISFTSPTGFMASNGSALTGSLTFTISGSVTAKCTPAAQVSAQSQAYRFFTMQPL